MISLKRVLLCTISLVFIGLLSIYFDFNATGSPPNRAMNSIFEDIDQSINELIKDTVKNIPEGILDAFMCDRNIARNYVEEFFDIFPIPQDKYSETQIQEIAKTWKDAGGQLDSPYDGFYVGGYVVKEFQKSDITISRWGFMIIGIIKGDITGYSIIDLSGNGSLLFKPIIEKEMLSLKGNAKVFSLRLPGNNHQLPFYSVLTRTPHPGVNRLLLHGRRGIALTDKGNRDWIKAILKWHPKAAHYYQCLSKGNLNQCSPGIQALFSCSQNSMICDENIKQWIRHIATYYDLPTTPLSRQTYSIGCASKTNDSVDN